MEEQSDRILSLPRGALMRALFLPRGAATEASAPAWIVCLERVSRKIPVWIICSVFHSKDSCCTKLLVLSSCCLQAQCLVVLGRLLVRITQMAETG
jgi:hypothetical protein